MDLDGEPFGTELMAKVLAKPEQCLALSLLKGSRGGGQKSEKLV